MKPALIGLDWGTSSLRAFLLGPGGAVLQSRQSDEGVQRLAGSSAEFERAFASMVGDWLGQWPALNAMACGMVGSAQGWREAPYATCPADAAALARQGVTVRTAIGATVHIAPGVRFEPAAEAPDVMRGEEVQVIGALRQDPAWAARSCIVLPGTHSKWVEVEQGRIVALRTYMTGELFAVLRGHSILGRLMPSGAPAADAPHAEAFARGIDAAASVPECDLLHQLFSVRTLGLTGRLPHEALADYLSGLLIGSELRAAMRRSREARDRPLLLIGEAALCRRYAQALAHMRQPAPNVLPNTAPAGLWALAEAAGVLAMREGST